MVWDPESVAAPSEGLAIRTLREGTEAGWVTPQGGTGVGTPCLHLGLLSLPLKRRHLELGSKASLRPTT